MTYKVKFQNVMKRYKMYDKPIDRLKDLFMQNSKGEYHYALRNVSFAVEEGEIVGIIGLNGSGKSTLSNLIAGVTMPNRGKVEINGTATLIAISSGLNGQLSGLENIELKGLMMGLTKEQVRDIIPKVIEFAEIGKFINQPVKTYSSGMKSRLGFAISIHIDPDILVIDEALSVGDPTFTDRCLDKMNEFKAQGKTIFFISHSLSQVKQFCTKGLWIHQGEVREYGDIETVAGHYQAFLDEYRGITQDPEEDTEPQVLRDGRQMYDNDEADSVEKSQYVFNPHKEAGLEEETRLVIHDGVADKFHILQVIPPMHELVLPKERFEPHLYYTYKYQVKTGGKWTNATKYKRMPIEMVTEDGIKYLYYHQEHSPALIVVFQGLNEVPSYNYVKTLKDIPVSKLFVKDDYGPPPTYASYYLGPDHTFSIAENTSKLVERVRAYNNLPGERVICAGSSKGGYAAMYQAYATGSGYAVAGGPQFLLGDYLGKNPKNTKAVTTSIYIYLTGSDSLEGREWANRILPDLMRSKQGPQVPQLYVHVGKGEPHYEEHVKPLEQFIAEMGTNNLEIDLGDYDTHAELAQHFPPYLQNTVQRLINQLPKS